MPFAIRAYNRFPVQGRVYYQGDRVVGQGVVWNLSKNGWRVDGRSSVEPGTALTLYVYLQRDQQLVIVDQAVVRWSRGQEFGLENVRLAAQAKARLSRLVTNLIQRPYRPPVLLSREEAASSDTPRRTA